MSDLFQRLAAPFPADRVSWRVGPTNKDKSKGMALAYIDARDVMERLDGVVGPASWQCRYPHANGKTVCEVGICVGTSREPTGEWIWKADGAGDTDMEAEKGALSDAFKRAAVRWGIGRYLYDVESVWVMIEPYGKSFKIVDSEQPRLRKLLNGGGAPPSRGADAGREPTASAAPTLSAKDSTDLGNKMIGAIRMATESSDLRDWGNDAQTKANIDMLHAPDKQRVRDEYKEHMKALEYAERTAA